MSKFFNRNWKAGFTLVELIVVIAILAILAGIAIPVYSGYIEKANQAADETLLDAVNTAFSAACVENGEYDMKNLSFTPTASLLNGKVTMSKFDKEFQSYFVGNGVFKYYDVIAFVKSEGVFKGTTETALTEALLAVWNGSSFSSDDGSAEKALLEQFDDIRALFSRYNGVLSILNSDSIQLPEGVKSLLDSFGLFGIANAVDMSQEDLEDYVRSKADDLIPGFSSMTEEEQNAEITRIANEYGDKIKGNAAVLYIASDATGQSAASVTSGVNDLVSIFKAAATGLSDEQAEELMKSYMDSDQLAAYDALDDDAKAAQLDSFKENTLNQQASGDAAQMFNMLNMHITNGQLAALNMAYEGSTALNEGGVSKLGALYALTTGFYNSEYGKDVDHSTEGGNNMFQSVLIAVTNEKFADYYEASGEADIQAYLSAMSVLSAHSDDIDLTSAEAFGEQYDYLAEILGIDEP